MLNSRPSEFNNIFQVHSGTFRFQWTGRQRPEMEQTGKIGTETPGSRRCQRPPQGKQNIFCYIQVLSIVLHPGYRECLANDVSIFNALPLMMEKEKTRVPDLVIEL